MTLEPISAESNLVELIESFMKKAEKYLNTYYKGATEYSHVENILGDIDTLACLSDAKALYLEFHPEEEEKELEAQFKAVQALELMNASAKDWALASK